MRRADGRLHFTSASSIFNSAALFVFFPLALKELGASASPASRGGSSAWALWQQLEARTFRRGKTGKHVPQALASPPVRAGDWRIIVGIVLAVVAKQCTWRVYRTSRCVHTMGSVA